ncbi:MAG: DUF4861 family protein [Bacteroidales bacterium]|nr:DUF4861 family protein [Bacteroidales bacterium]
MMRRLLLLFLPAALALAGCKEAQDPRVMAREVPERADDFVFENDLVAGRFYGEALEGETTSPGLDIWVKLPGRLVADEWYAKAVEEPGYYHHDHGGKDCYKVGVSLGGGASVPFIDGRLCWPATNYRSGEILEVSPDKIVFSLHYPAWEAAEGVPVSLDKRVTVEAGSYFIKVEDTYRFTGADSITVAAGVKLHGDQDTIVEKLEAADRIALWEKASDQGSEPEDGLIGVAVVMPEADSVLFSGELDHALLTKRIPSGGTVSYQAGSCWSKGDMKDAAAWFDFVRKQ